jgi:peptidyl-prolyl cis-trans isomerase D
MLHAIREGIQGWIAWAIVILLIVPFALWGINQYFGSGGPQVVATVNGKDISQREFQQAYYLQRNRMREMLGGQYDPSMFDEQIKQRALQGLIDQEILFQNAEDRGFRVASESVVQTIKNIEAFQENGSFSNDMYVRALQAQGETPASFEQRIHRAILTQQLQSGVATSAIVTDDELNRLLKLQHQTRDIDHLRIAVAKHKNDADATDEAIEKYYDEHSDLFMNPEKVSIEYVELKAENLGEDMQPTEEQLQQFYETRKSQYFVPEERRTRHILISVAEDADKETIEKARAKAEEVKQKLDNGESFEKLAKEYSDDPGSAQMGGDIGFFGRDQLDPAYERAMFELEPGQISDPVLSSFGFHIIRLEEIREEKSKPLEQIKDQLIAEWRKSQGEKKFFEEVDKLTTLAYEVPTTLTDAAGAVEQPVQSTDLFSRKGGKGITSNPKVINAAFSNDVLVEGYNSEPIELSENHVVVLRVKEHVEKSPQSLEEAKEEIKKRLVEDKARERVKELGEKVVDRLQAGETPQAIAEDLDLEWIKSGELKRSDRKIDSAIVKQAFKLQRPQEGQAAYGGTVLGNGDYAVVAVNKVVDGDPAQIDESQKLTLKRSLVAERGRQAFENLLSEIKGSANIVVQKDNI